MKHYPKFIALTILIAIILVIIALNRHFHSPAFQARRLLAELRLVGEPPNTISEILMDMGFITDVGQRHPTVIIDEGVVLGESAVPIFLPALDDDNENVRHYVANILSEMGSQAQSAIPHLIQKISENPDLNHQLLLTEILSSIGDPAVGALQELAARDSEREKLLVAIALSEIDHNLIDNELSQLYLDSLSSLDHNIRLLATYVAWSLGPDAADAAPLLIPLLKEYDTELQSITSSALNSIGPPAIPHLIKALENDEQTIQILVADILTNIDPNAAAEESLDILIEIMQDELSTYRHAIIDIMHRMGPSAQKAAPHLLKMVQKSDRTTKLQALEALQAIKPTDSRTITELMEMLKQPYQEIRRFAVDILQTIEFNDEQKLTVLNKILTDSNFEQDPQDVSAALVNILIDPYEIIPLFQDVLAELVGSRLSGPPLGAGYPSWGIGYPVAPIPLHTSIIDSAGSLDPDLIAVELSILRQTAILSLAKIAPESIDNERIDAIIDNLQKKDDSIPVVTGRISIDQSIHRQQQQKARVLAAYTLGQIGPSVKHVTEDLKKSLETPDNFTRIAIAWALTKIAPETELQHALDIITAAFDQPDPYIRQKVICALQDIGVVNDQVINILIRAVESEDYEIQLAAIDTLALFGPAAQNAVPAALERVADNSFLDISIAAREALKKIKKNTPK